MNMPALRLALLVVALVLFALSAAGVRHPRYDFVAAGLAVWMLAQLTT